MKGIYIHNQIEYRVEITGDKFSQGDNLACLLTIKNHSLLPKVIEQIVLQLGVCNLKNIKSGVEDCFELVESAKLSAIGSISPAEQKTVSWEFVLSSNCPVSTKNDSVCILYGDPSVNSPQKFLPLTVSVHPVIEKICNVFESHLQFVSKGVDSDDGWTVLKFKPSSERKFSLVNELSLHTKFDAADLDLKYLFNVKKFDASVSSISVKRGKSSVDQRWVAAEYLLSGQHINYPYIEDKIEKALSTVATGL